MGFTCGVLFGDKGLGRGWSGRAGQPAGDADQAGLEIWGKTSGMSGSRGLNFNSRSWIGFSALVFSGRSFASGEMGLNSWESPLRGMSWGGFMGRSWED